MVCRVKIATTSNAIGQAAPLYVVVSVSESQMPAAQTPDGFRVMKLEGFCISGTSTPDHTACGYVAFVRSDGSQSASILRFEHQNEKFIEFINKIRLQQCQYKVIEGQPVPVLYKAVCWHDGAMDQLTANINNYKQYEDNNMTCNKQNAARTGVEQSEDCQDKYKATGDELKKNSHYEEQEELKQPIQRYSEQTV